VEQVLGWANSVRAATLQFLAMLNKSTRQHNVTKTAVPPEIEQLPKYPTTWRPFRTVP
jgi:hypothetical protein